MALRHGVLYNQFRGHRLVTDSAVEPITKSEVKNQLGIDDSFIDDDALLDIYIEAARQFAEAMTGLALINQQWRLTLDRWPSTGGPWWDGVREGAIGALESQGRAADVFPPRYPLKTVDELKVDAVAKTAADYFVIDTQQMPGRLALKSGATFPPVTNAANGIDILYTAGFGATADDVPAALRQGLIMMVAHLYSHRGDECSTEDAYRLSGCKAQFSAYKARGL